MSQVSALQEAAGETRKFTDPSAEPQQERRSTRARATPAHIVESAAASDVDTEAETESDTEFMTGAKKVITCTQHVGMRRSLSWQAIAGLLAGHISRQSWSMVGRSMHVHSLQGFPDLHTAPNCVHVTSSARCDPSIAQNDVHQQCS